MVLSSVLLSKQYPLIPRELLEKSIGSKIDNNILMFLVYFILS